MITALVQFKLPQPITRAKAQEIFASTAPRYRETPGLIRKYYLTVERREASTCGNHGKTPKVSTRNSGATTFARNTGQHQP